MKTRLMKKRTKQLREKPYLAEVINYNLPPEEERPNNPFEDGMIVLVLGEVDQMKNHVAVVTPNGKTHFGWGIEYFRKLTREES